MDLSACLIYNPAAGAFNVGTILPEIVATLQSYGWQLDVCQTQRRGDIDRLAQAAIQQGRQVVFVAGGDGSLSEAANALAHSQTALGVLPTGTGNVFARQLGMPIPKPWNPSRLVKAAQTLATGQVRTIDLGWTAGRYFLMWSGAGLDGEAIASIEPKPPMVRRFGMIGYATQIVWVALRYHGTQMVIQADQETITTRALLAVVSNGPLFGVIFRLAPAAMLDDGYLDLTILKGDNLLMTASRVINLLLGRVAKDPQAILRQVRRIEVVTADPIPVEVDGEPLARTPILIEVVPQALRILTPRRTPSNLFKTD